MRISLNIRRHGLPSVSLIWPLKPADLPNQTIVQFLEAINDAIPLESSHWGLDDYVVTIHGNELLHYMKVADVVEKDDEVIVRPLQTSEIRARTLGGRYQISAAGQHLTDGIAFGKPWLRRPTRPLVNIPPAKRRRVGWGEEDEEEDLWDEEGLDELENRLQLQDTPRTGDNHGFQDEDEDKEDDEDWVPEGVKDVYIGGRSTADDRYLPPKTSKARKSVTFNDRVETNEDRRRVPLMNKLPALTTLDKDDEDSEDDFLPSSDENSDSDSDSTSNQSEEQMKSARDDSDSDLEDSDYVSTSSDDTSSLDDDSSDSSEMSEPEDQPAKPPATKKQIDAESSSSSAPSESEDEPKILPTVKTKTAVTEPKKQLQQLKKVPSEGSSNSVLSKAKSESTAKLQSNKKDHTPDQPVIPPGKGQKETRERNKRRKDSKRLRALKARGLLPANADRADLSEYLRKTNQTEEGFEEEDLARSQDNATRIPRNGSNDIMGINGSHTSAEGGTHNKENKNNGPSGTGEQTSDLALVSSAHYTINSDVQDDTMKDDTLPTKRARLDLAGSRRLVFGSLGVRTPKTKEDEDRLRNKLSAKQLPRELRAAKVAQDATTAKAAKNTPPPDPEDPDAWKSKVVLSAIECWDKTVEELSTPPYPFKQRWDPQQDASYYHTRSKRTSKKRKLAEAYGRGETEDIGYMEENSYNYNHEEGPEYEGEYPDGGLNYDDEVIQEDTEAAESQLIQETEIAEFRDDSVDGGIPPLPPDPSILSPLDYQDVVQGAIIVFKQLEVSQATKWEPKMSGWKTATVEGCMNSLVYIKLAARDIPKKEKKFDHEGRRMYEKFEMASDSEDEDEGFLAISFDELVEPKFLREAKPVNSGKEGVEIVEPEDSNTLSLESVTAVADGVDMVVREASAGAAGEEGIQVSAEGAQESPLIEATA
ncbi:hypothetical protein M501DRAFT_1016495 [Patellaria atrata CBS 101060]|uniref:DUF7357 domain-containing protein n=1 Tax=Patellaria atrata CBS 101060 TaxID=1346257 RepID=A0A9P4VQ33_9PEZI|nr:hypothetical protein M501DRAFT_1016495 [Patellaria atrata CBS 101060]